MSDKPRSPRVAPAQNRPAPSGFSPGPHSGPANPLVPVYPYRCAPDGLMTRRQLRAAGLRPGGVDPVAEIRWRRGQRFALLYDRTRALPVRPMTAGRRRALEAAMRARRTCPACRIDRGYVISRSLGTCVPCDLR